MLSTNSNLLNAFVKIRKSDVSESYGSFDVFNTFLICAVVLKAKNNGLSLDKSSKELCNELYGKDCPGILNDIDIKNLSAFEEISETDLRTYLLDYQSILSTIGKRNAEFFIPEKIISLFCKILDLTDSDKLNMIGEPCSISALQVANSYSVSKLYSYSMYYKNKEFAEILSDALGFNIEYICGEYYGFNYVELANKVISVPMWNCSTKHNVMGQYLIEKGYAPSHYNSAEAGILFALDALTEDGIAVVCVPLNLIQKSGTLVFKDIIDKKQLKAVISLPGGLFSSTDIKTAILILSKKPVNTVRFVNGSEFFTKNRKLRNELSDTNIMEITNAYYNKSEYAKDVSTEEIRTKNYSLNCINYFVEPKIIIPGFGRNKYPFVKISDLLTAKPIRGTLIKSEVLDSEVGNTSYRYLTSKNIVDNEIDIEQITEIPEQDKKVNKYCLKENDIIISVVTTDVIKVAIVKDIGDLKIVMSNMLYKLTPNPDKVHPLFLKAVLSNPAATRLFKVYSTGTGATSTLPIDVLCNTEITLPPLEKQNMFVKNYEDLMNTRHILVEQIHKIDKSKDLLFLKSFQEK